MTLRPPRSTLFPYTKANEGRDDKLYAGFFRGDGRALRGSWLVVADPGLNPDAVTMPREEGEPLEDADFNIQAEKRIQLAFFSAPLQALESGTLIESFLHPEILGCEPRPELDEVSAPDPGP